MRARTPRAPLQNPLAHWRPDPTRLTEVLLQVPIKVEGGHRLVNPLEAGEGGLGSEGERRRHGVLRSEEMMGDGLGSKERGDELE